MDMIDLGQTLFGADRSKHDQAAVKSLTATAMEDSANGVVRVWIDGEPVQVACMPSVKAGQEVTVSVVNRRPTVTGVDGWGDAISSKMGEIAAEVAYIDQAYISELVANNITAAHIVASAAYIGLLEAGDITADTIKAASVYVDALKAEYAEVSDLKADLAKIGTLDADKADIDLANIDTANIAVGFVEWLSAGYAHITEGVIDNARIGFADIDDVDIKSAMIDVAEIRKMLVTSGIIGEFVSESGKITGVLDAVRINADTIKAGTLSVDRLLLRGEGGLFYEINKTTEGVTSEELSTDEYQNALHGSNIVAASITAEKISVTDLVAFGATIGGLVIENGCLHSFAKTSLGSAAKGMYFGADGSAALGGASSYVKYDAAADAVEIRAKSITLGASSVATEGQVSTAQAAADKAKADAAAAQGTANAANTAASGAAAAAKVADDKAKGAQTTVDNLATAIPKTYATKAALKVESDKITANVTETSKLGTRMSTVEQTASGLSVSLSGVKDTADATAKNLAANYATKYLSDTRSTNQPPSWYYANYPLQIVTEFKNPTAIGIPALEGFCVLETTAPWSDSSGGWPKQSVKIAGKEYWRVGISTTAWGAWNDSLGTAQAAAKTATNFMEFSSAGLDVGNKSSGKWSGFRSRMAAGAFQVLDAAGSVVASYGAKIIELGKGSADAVIEFCAGKARIDISGGKARFSGVGGVDVLAAKVGSSYIASGSAGATTTSDGTGSTAGLYTEVATTSGAAAKNASVVASSTTSGSSVALKATSITANSNPLYGAQVLYDNASGTAGTVTLSASAAGFAYLEVFCGKLDGTSGGYCCQRIFAPNGKRITINQYNYISSAKAHQLIASKYLISGNTLIAEVVGATTTLYNNAPVTTNPAEGRQLVYRVVGYR